MLHIASLAALIVLAASSNAPEAICTDAHLARERTRITARLTVVERELRAVDTSHLDVDLRMKRARLLDTLHTYTARGVFPQNNVTGTLTPIFVDDGARTCAVAELLMRDGRSDVVREVVARENLARVPVMQTESLLAWAATSGFSVDELARIQPSYNPCSGLDRSCINAPCSGPPDACVGATFDPDVCDDLGQTFGNECIAKTCITSGATEEKCYDDQGCSTLHGTPSTTIAGGALALALLARRRRR
jgi:uncharacterized protein (TIGR03382 family)